MAVGGALQTLLHSGIIRSTDSEQTVRFCVFRHRWTGTLGLDWLILPFVVPMILQIPPQKQNELFHYIASA